MSMRTRVDGERCTGHGRCYSLARDLYDADDEGHGVALHAEVPAELWTKARRAADECPERAIMVVES
jgi:ferredoxin